MLRRAGMREPYVPLFFRTIQVGTSPDKADKFFLAQDSDTQALRLFKLGAGLFPGVFGIYHDRSL